MKIGIATHEFYGEVIDHFRQVTNSSQNYFQVEPIELTSEEEDIIEPRDLRVEQEEEIEHRLYQMKIAHGYGHSDLFIANIPDSNTHAK